MPARLTRLLLLATSALALPARAIEPESVVAPVAIQIPHEQAKDHAGQRVVIEAEVKGVSFSPRSGVTYLNFGDAYPRQTLSCKIPKEQEAVRKHARGAFGRIARVSGIVENTSTGPVITLLEPGQISFLPHPPDNVLNETGEGLAYLWRVNDALARLFEQKDYAALETLAARWRAARTRMLDGRWLLPAVYGLGQSRLENDEDYLAAISRLEAWRRARPQAIEPVIALAELQVRHAWFARGGGWAYTVTEEGWRLMGERLKIARALLEGLGPRFDECPHAAEVMQSVALGQGWTDAEYDALFARALRREPEYPIHHHNRALRLLPRWHGKPGEWEATLRAGADTPFGRELLARIPWGLRRYHGNILLESALDWPEVQSGFEELLRRYPRSARNRSAYALFAGMAGDRATCLRLLDELGDTLDMELWVNWENAELARRWIADSEQTPPVIFRPVRLREEEPFSLESTIPLASLDSASRPAL